MTDLTQEDIVTNLLTSNDILKPRNNKVYISNPNINTLGEFLADIKIQYINTPSIENDSKKYIFIKNKRTLF
jgi:hypothetical protein